MACPRCTARQLVEISVTITDRKVTLHSCSRCETKWWDEGSGSEVIELRDVLQLATVRR
jgi:transcription elongation factor Elf1